MDLDLDIDVVDIGIPFTPGSEPTRGMPRSPRSAGPLDLSGDRTATRDDLAVMTMAEICAYFALPARLAGVSALARARDDYDHEDNTAVLDRAAVNARYH